METADADQLGIRFFGDLFMSHSCAQVLCDTPHYEEDSMPEIEYITCPLHLFIDCMKEMNRNEMAEHLSHYHPDYHHDPEPYFEAEAERRAKAY